MNVLNALCSIKSAKGDVREDGEVIAATLTLITGEGQVEMTLDQWNDLYSGFVRCWPAVKPVKDRVIKLRFEANQRELMVRRKQKERDAKAARLKRAKKSKPQEKPHDRDEDMQKAMRAADAAQKKGLIK